MKKEYGPNVKAMLIHRKIYKLKQELLERIKKSKDFKKYEKDVLTLLKKEKIDLETLERLKPLMGVERPMTIGEQLEQVAYKTIEKYEQLNPHYQKDRIILALTDGGDLYREPKTEYCYSMRGEGLRLKILRLLIKHQGFCKTEEIVEYVSSTSKESLRDAIGTINSKARTLLNLPVGMHKRLIISKSHSGYMINPIYVIMSER